MCVYVCVTNRPYFCDLKRETKNNGRKIVTQGDGVRVESRTKFNRLTLGLWNGWELE